MSESNIEGALESAEGKFTSEEIFEIKLLLEKLRDDFVGFGETLNGVHEDCSSISGMLNDIHEDCSSISGIRKQVRECSRILDDNTRKIDRIHDALPSRRPIPAVGLHRRVKQIFHSLPTSEVDPATGVITTKQTDVTEYVSREEEIALRQKGVPYPFNK